MESLSPRRQGDLGELSAMEWLGSQATACGFRSATVPTAILVLVADGRRWFIPARAVEARTGLLLGGPKYAEFEIDRGRPLPSRDQP